MGQEIADSGSAEHLNLVSPAHENEFPAAFIALNPPIKADTFANKPISERRNRVAIPLDGDLTLRVEEGAELD